jgi:UDP:flavonoid glycosyltransferase YjiC (YdhE family)
VSNVLVAPLDWGLGHASRCIQIIRLLLEQDHSVILAGDGRSLELLKQEFPNLLAVDLPGYDIAYSRSGFIVWTMLKQLPKIAKGIYCEHKLLDKIIREQ